ncbi:MAG TPA: ankyrin repeat domain-containing protein, partial [Rickettsia endosymbiont of Omalisus fontisbellaquei]|nr:ankyrin repeat domain-containing protein [Rickettsia endosymbiont of Omalisus fontisbellaquei]
MKSKYIDISNIFNGNKPQYLDLKKHPANKDNKIYLSDLDKSDVIGYSLLHHAVENGDEKFVKLLLENGAFVNLVSERQSKKKPIELAANKIKKHQKQEEVIKYKNIQSMLIDYGADSSPITTFQPNTKKIVQVKKKVLNKQIVIECAEENKKLEKIYLDFYNFLQSELFHKISEIKSKINHFKSGKHIDEVNEDFCARITRYYKEDIINPDADIGHKIEQESRNSGDNIQLTLTSLLSGIAKKELLEKYQKEGEKILLPHWEQIADKAIAQFMNYLKNTEVSYNADLGIKAAESFLPNYSKGIMQLDAKLNKFSIDTAKKLGAVVQLAYESKKKIEEVSKDWGFEECYVRQSDLFKSVVMCNEEKIIIAFRGTYHNQNWLSNIHALKTTIKIKEQDITVHTGFHEALMTHWDRENDNEKPLKEIIKKYLNDYPKAKIYITGHSLGGAMASIAYCKLLELGTKIGKPIEIDNVSLYTYGQPLWMTANSEAIVKELFKGNYYRIANYQDLVPTVPPESLGYKHLGELYYLHKDGRMIDQKTFDQIKLQKDTEGYSQITNNPVAKALYIEQHFISNYNKQLNNCKNIVISKETSVSQPINVNEAYIADQIQISDPLCKEALAKLESLLINSKLEDPKQQDMVIKLMEERIETTEISKPLQQQSKSIKPATKKKATNIFEAAAYGDLEKFQSFLVKGSNINKVDEFGSTVLHYAARGGHERLAEILLNKKPELIDMVDEFGNTVLHSAAMGGNEKLAEILLNKKPELIDMVTNIGSTVLYYAASGGNEKLAEMLLKARVKCKLDDLHSLNSTSQKKEGIAECYYLCGLRKSKEGANLEATKAYTKALELNPYKYNLASSFISNQLKLNKDFVQQQLAMQANSKSLYQLAVLYLLQNEYEKGLNIFNSTEVDARVKPAFSLGAALALVKLGKYTEAEQLLTNYKTTAETLSTDYWYITAELMVGLKQYKETFTCYSKLTDYGYHMGAIAGIGNLYFKTNQLRQAKECYLKILADKNVDFNLTERAEQQITFIETAEFINKQIAIEQTVQNLTMEFDKSLAETIAFDLIYAKKWLQQNLPKSLSNYHKILNEIDYGYKLLNSEGILPKTFGFMSDFLPKEKQLISFAWADKELRTEHDYFKIINNIYKQLESLKEVISKNGTLKDDIKEEALVKINQVQDYYKYYIEQVIIEYGANYRQTTYDDKKYVTILSKIAEEKKPLLSKEILGNKTKVQFEDGKHGFLEPILSQKLTTNKPQAGNKYGKHLVVEVNSVHYKYSPYAPGIEFAVNSLHNLILDGITPPSKLLKISTESGQEKAIYLASKTIKGENLQKILFLPTEYMQKLDMENYSGTIIACLLTSPGDAKPDNFMVTFGVNKDSGKKSFKIVGIDNDISFCKGKLGVNKIAGKQKIYSDILNVLYFFPQMDELVSPKLKEYLTSSNITGERIISSWLKALYTQNTRYTDNGFTKDDLDEMKLPIKFKAGTVVEVYRKLDGIINLLKANEYITHNALFKKFYPGVSYFYEKIRQQSKGEFEAIKQLYMAAAESEELAQQLVSREVQERDAAWNKISTSRMMNQETFKQVYDHTIEKETEDFIAAIDFGKFGREDYAVFRMLQDNLNFVQELKLYNVT